jgi:hypothetical protein
MKKENINLFLESLKIVLASNITNLFLKTEGEENAKTRKYNKNLEIIENAINKNDDDTELFLIALKDSISNLTPSKEMISKLKYLFGYNTVQIYLPFSKDAGINETTKWSSDNTQTLAEYTLINGGKGVNITKVININALWWSNPANTSVKGKQFYKVTGVTPEKQILFGNESNRDKGVIADHDDVYEVNWDLNVNSSGKQLMSQILTKTMWKGDCNITIEQVPEYVENMNTYLFITKFKSVLESFTPNVNDLNYVLKYLSITIED